MALNPNKIGVIKQVICDDKFHADKLENYIDKLIEKGFARHVPFKFRIFWDALPSEKAISEVKKRYLNAGWKSFSHEYGCSSDSRGDRDNDVGCYFELR